MAKAENRGVEGEDRDEAGGAGKARVPRKRVWLPVGVFILTILLLVLHRCDREIPPVEPPLLPSKVLGAPQTALPETLTAPPAPIPDTAPAPRPPKVTIPHPVPASDTPAARVMAPDSGLPYLYADPWGGRHFDSVKVSLHCREGCLVLYSLEDSVSFKSYEAALTFRRNTTLWLSGIDSAGRQIPPIRIDYVIERNPGACRENSMPVTSMPVTSGTVTSGTVSGGMVSGGGRTVCMDVYEWPNKEGEQPRAFVDWKDASDSCRSAGKRLCTVEEWQNGCRGPDRETYPYSGRYNENHCPAKEAAAARSGRFPACRSYYGLYDMTGNLWEWTSTPAGGEGEFFFVAGGNWNAGNEAKCGQAKFSFYPAVRYPFVGFRCCKDATGP